MSASRLLTAAALVSVVLLGACTANPPPPITRTDSPVPTTTTPTKNTVVVAVDDIGTGFNPHLVAAKSPTNAMVSALVLPSPFRPVMNPTRPGTTDWVPDRSVLVSAEVTAQVPFTVTYRLRNEAQWSDGAPIAAEDFRYLWQQMIRQEGVVDPAGYRLIADVASSGGGKTVTVTMKSPYPAWRELFTDLLPAHLVKDLPGGFERGLDSQLKVSGSLFHIKTTDPERGEILLERNDRFWDRPAKPDQILMRRGGTAAALAESIRSGDTQVANMHGGEATRSQLAAIPAVRTDVALQPRQIQLALNGRFGDLTDPRLRRGLLALLDQQLLATVAEGVAAPANLNRAMVVAPSTPGYVATEPPPLNRDQAYGLLAEAGYQRTVPAAGTTAADRVTKGDKQLRLRIGVVDSDRTAVAVANTAADQLRSAGVDATVRPMAAGDLFGPGLVGGPGNAVVIDAVVSWQQSGTDPATVLASRYGCPPAVAAVPGSASTTPEVPNRDGDPVALAPSNLSGVCDPSLQPAIEAALRGAGDVARIIADAEPKLWNLAVVLPIVQDSTVVAAGPGVTGVSLTGPVQAGPLADAAGWSRGGA